MAGLPSFFIAGAPKCGTTALWSYLRGHPGVYLPEVKEPHFFSSDLPGLRAVADEAGYRALFAAAPAGALAGEASASTLHSRAAVPAILAAVPDARFVVLLRDPAEMAVALHGEMLANLNEDLPDFRMAWELQEQRAAGAAVPVGCREPAMLQYREVCALGDHLEGMMGQVAPERLLPLLLEDLAADPAAAYRRVLGFLGLPDDGRRAFSRENPAAALRSRRLAVLHGHLPRLLGPLYRPLRVAGRALGLRPSDLMARFNRRPRDRASLAPDFRDELTHAFAPQVAKLARLTGRDLSHWPSAGAGGR